MISLLLESVLYLYVNELANYLIQFNVGKLIQMHNYFVCAVLCLGCAVFLLHNN